ncbi:hypothetical protein BegalDRAFT_3242 [Beggiatoa alba B18LD]|uniref:DUF302 domain-containing protein n=1 Tax=Beggiatoa alba B18LD TaxID=395493 RepID=I3CKC0_9GAMM|nr:DUF302 domain-containing protein [Beggiatoa alba]EIJ44063.1 hypothetical protein BegalDRAFT_3242 [Beggiatoa alba B18LD]
MRYLSLILCCLLQQAVFATEPSATTANPANMPAMTLAQTIVKFPIAEGVSMDSAIDSMKLRANSLNMKLVAHQPMWKEFEAQGHQKVRRVEIFQFCNIDVARDMLDFNIDFVAYMPCRIAAIEDDTGKGWLVMMNLDLLMQLTQMPPDLLPKAQKVRDDLMEIIQAGANGEL